mmetsp:Transcript_36923/g.88918  ORF Transcript_36923/g.88918 Transcript_36923/m.88918 type:complete len:283 (+) Transcript_36923:69-917(+)
MTPCFPPYDIETAILKEFNTTQEDLSRLVEELQNKTSAAEDALKKAVNLDKLLDVCRGEEQDLMRELEQCLADHKDKIDSHEKACQEATDTKNSTCAERDDAAIIDLPGGLCIETTCNLTAGDCGVDQYSKTLDSVKETVAQQQKNLEEKVTECSNAQTNATEMCKTAAEYAETKPCDAKEKALASKVSVCDHSSESASVAICSFGMHLQSKCADLSAVHKRVEDIKESGSESSLSEPDRQEEWAAVQRVICLLEALRDDGDLSTGAATTCAENHPYPKTFD